MSTTTDLAFAVAADLLTRGGHPHRLLSATPERAWLASTRRATDEAGELTAPPSSAMRLLESASTREEKLTAAGLSIVLAAWHVLRERTSTAHLDPEGDGTAAEHAALREARLAVWPPARLDAALADVVPRAVAAALEAG